MNDVMQGRWTLLHVIGLVVWQKPVKSLSLVEESYHYSLSLSDRPVAVRHTRIDLHTAENPTG